MSQAFILNRAQKTAAVYAAIGADWVWEVMTVAQFNARKAEVEAQLDVVEDLRLTMVQKRDAFDTALATLHEHTVTIGAQAHAKWGNDPLKRGLLRELSGIGESREEIISEARTLAKAWPKLDAAWEPVNALDLADYQALRVSIEGVDTATPPTPGLQDQFNTAHADWREGADGLRAELESLEDSSEAWYEMGTAVWAEDTAHGNLIRGQVPTTYDPSNEPLPVPGKPMGVSAGPGTDPGEVVVVCLPSLYASTYNATASWESSGGPQTTTTQSGTNTLQFTGLPTGTPLEITVFASNATGEGPLSDTVTLTLP